MADLVPKNVIYSETDIWCDDQMTSLVNVLV